AARYWDDAIDVSDEGIVEGHNAIERRLAEVFKSKDPKDFTNTIDKAQISGDHGWFVGRFSETRLGPDGVRRPATGYVMVVLERRDGMWKARAHMTTLAG